MPATTSCRRTGGRVHLRHVGRPQRQGAPPVFGRLQVPRSARTPHARPAPASHAPRRRRRHPASAGPPRRVRRRCAAAARRPPPVRRGGLTGHQPAPHGLSEERVAELDATAVHVEDPLGQQPAQDVGELAGLDAGGAGDLALRQGRSAIPRTDTTAQSGPPSGATRPSSRSPEEGRLTRVVVGELLGEERLSAGCARGCGRRPPSMRRVGSTGPAPRSRPRSTVRVAGPRHPAARG